MKHYSVAAFYQFCPLPNYEALRPEIHKFCSEKSVKGIILLANEGINGTIAGSDNSISQTIAYIKGLHSDFCFEPKLSYTDEMPFLRLKVKPKAEIVPLGVTGLAPSFNTGFFVEPHEWNKLIEDESVTVIDVRNDYEVRLGTFERAIDPKTKSFRDFPSYVEKTLDPNKNKKIAMFCTGGIRCEKASAFLIENGFSEVYQLKGGILKYLELVEPEQSKWSGDCFVFDKRVAVGHGLTPSDVDLCYGCLSPLTSEDRTSPEYEIGVCCPYCAAIQTERQKSAARERKRQISLSRKKGKVHLGPKCD